MVGVAALDAYAGLVRGDDGSPMQGRDGLVATRAKAPLRALEQVHEPALAEPQTEQVGQRRLQPLVGERLEGLEIRRHRMEPWAEGCSPRRLRHGCDHPRPAGRAVHRQPSMLGDGRRDLRQLDLLGNAYDLCRKSGVQVAAAA